MNKVIYLLMVFLLLSCKETKQVVNSKKVKEDQSRIEKFLKEGYKVGVFINNKSGDCYYLIKDKESSNLFDPVNINDKKYSKYKSSKDDIYYKYQSLRRMNRCSNAQPIELIDVKLLKEE